MTTPAQARLIEAVASRFGSRVVTTDADAIAPWLSDWRGRFHGAAAALFSPESTEQVAAIVGLARDHIVPLVPQGGNTSMVGGATPPADGSAVILSLRRLNRIRSMSADENLAVAEAGVILADLHAAAEDAGRRFPLTLGAVGSATVGGLVSTNAGGVQVLRWGTMRALVAGVEAVLPDGTIHDGLAPLKKDNRGYDINQLMIGAEGTLGVVTAAALRLAPAIGSRTVAWVGLDTPQAALALLRRFEAAGDAVESFELINGGLVALAAARLGGRAPLDTPAPWQLLLEAVAAPGEDAPTGFVEGVLAVALDAGEIGDAVLAASEAQAERFWALRHALSDTQRARGAVVAHDISIPVAAMPDFMMREAARVAAAFPGVEVLGFGHLGDGNVHFDALSPPDVDRAAWLAAHGADITRFVNDAVVAAGGSISAEHGIGQMKLAELQRLGPASRLHALAAIKTAFDPAGLFNPGKLVPVAPRGDAT